MFHFHASETACKCLVLVELGIVAIIIGSWPSWMVLTPQNQLVPLLESCGCPVDPALPLLGGLYRTFLMPTFACFEKILGMPGAYAGGVPATEASPQGINATFLPL